MRFYLPTIGMTFTLLGYLVGCAARELHWYDALFAMVMGAVWMLAASQLVRNREWIAQVRAREKAAKASA